MLRRSAQIAKKHVDKTPDVMKNVSVAASESVVPDKSMSGEDIVKSCKEHTLWSWSAQQVS